LTIGYLREASRVVGVNIRPWRSVLPSRAFTTIGVGGFQPALVSFEMSARSSSSCTSPPALRRTLVGGVIGVE
jgi:hypothetical protein